jgi:hypothetical protein
VRLGRRFAVTWFAVDDRFDSHPKTLVLRESPQYCAAITLWTLAGAWCARHAWETGEVPDPVVCNLGVPDWREASALLLDVGLWERRPGGVLAFHDWADWNGPDAKSRRIERRLANDRERQRRQRARKRSADDARANDRERKARSRRHRCERGDHSPDCPAGCPARSRSSPP